MKAISLLISGLSAVNNALLEICRVLSIALVAAITGVVSAGVFWRYVLNNSLSWSDELAKFLMVWLVFVGAPIAMRMGDHVSIDMFPDLFPPRGRAVLMAILLAIVIWFCVVLGYYSLLFAWNGWKQVAISIGRVPLFWIFVSVPVGMALILLVALQQFLEQIQEFLAPGTGERDPFLDRYEDLLREVGGE
ncbi:TRAP-type C4-dicarboxylate transport system permease small subunit [Defluviimonas denitrificans]|jgi:TRAP-type C4-dicarboxylate transport system permease small subunit|uniref:TRAP transporter small permease protein n=1 Tax=Albidovulum denitrificans TaxID=404881 RepID=A0A2S8RWE4_9RHOB|nr:TRAP transporter small permease [Defluviimonas denitrificans]PQV52853.1 TRAP-type C4-dicarboxylate transport system permease small subunit [Defluviimonas denitrificans]